MNNEVPKWFRKKFKKFQKLVRKHGTSFYGLGMFARDKYGNHDKEVGNLLLELMEYEPFLNDLRAEFGFGEET